MIAAGGKVGVHFRAIAAAIQNRGGRGDTGGSTGGTDPDLGDAMAPLLATWIGSKLSLISVRTEGCSPAISPGRTRCSMKATKVATTKSMISFPAGRMSRNAFRERETIPSFDLRKRAIGVACVWSIRKS